MFSRIRFSRMRSWRDGEVALDCAASGRQACLRETCLSMRVPCRCEISPFRGSADAAKYTPDFWVQFLRFTISTLVTSKCAGSFGMMQCNIDPTLLSFTFANRRKSPGSGLGLFASDCCQIPQPKRPTDRKAPRRGKLSEHASQSCLAYGLGMGWKSKLDLWPYVAIAISVVGFLYLLLRSIR